MVKKFSVIVEASLRESKWSVLSETKGKEAGTFYTNGNFDSETDLIDYYMGLGLEFITVVPDHILPASRKSFYFIGCC